MRPPTWNHSVVSVFDCDGDSAAGGGGTTEEDEEEDDEDDDEEDGGLRTGSGGALEAEVAAMR